MIDGGFKDASIERLNAVFEFNPKKDYTIIQQATAAPVIAMLGMRLIKTSANMDQFKSFSRLPSIGVEVRLNIPMQQKAHYNIIHSFILGTSLIGYEIGL